MSPAPRSHLNRQQEQSCGRRGSPFSPSPLLMTPVPPSGVWGEVCRVGVRVGPAISIADCGRHWRPHQTVNLGLLGATGFESLAIHHLMWLSAGPTSGSIRGLRRLCGPAIQRSGRRFGESVMRPGRTDLTAQSLQEEPATNSTRKRDAANVAKPVARLERYQRGARPSVCPLHPIHRAPAEAAPESVDAPSTQAASTIATGSGSSASHTSGSRSWGVSKDILAAAIFKATGEAA